MRGDTKKKDHGKTMWDLLPWGAVRKVAEIFTQGVEEYGAYSWRTVPNWRNRYYAALLRHLQAWFHDGEWADARSGKPHLAHAAWYCLTMMWLACHYNEDCGVDTEAIIGVDKIEVIEGERRDA